MLSTSRSLQSVNQKFNRKTIIFRRNRKSINVKPRWTSTALNEEHLYVTNNMRFHRIILTGKRLPRSRRVSENFRLPFFAAWLCWVFCYRLHRSHYFRNFAGLLLIHNCYHSRDGQFNTLTSLLTVLWRPRVRAYTNLGFIANCDNSKYVI